MTHFNISTLEPGDRAPLGGAASRWPRGSRCCPSRGPTGLFSGRRMRHRGGSWGWRRSSPQSQPAPSAIEGRPAAPAYLLTLDRSIPELGVGAMVWDPAWCNPDTTLRRCTIG